MTDLILFGCLFAVFAVLRNNTFGGPGGSDLFSMPFVLSETMLLLTSSFTCGLAMIALHKGDRKQVMGWLIITFLLGLAFLGMELYEFNKLVAEGESWRRSAFLTSFFTLVGTHGAHITAGLIWIGVMLTQLRNRGITGPVSRRLAMFGLFWHFLDVVWIFIFTIVFLYGEI